MKKFIGNSKFISLSGDASEARKISSEKEVVFCKVLVKGFKGYIPCTFLLKCQSLKDFGSADAKGTFKAMLDAITFDRLERLELGMKDAYESYDMFKKIKEMLVSAGQRECRDSYLPLYESRRNQVSGTHIKCIE